MFGSKLLVVALVLAITLVKANPDESHGRRNNRHRELLKPETNAIDHGPNHKSAHLFGHRGEHWGGLKKNKKKMKKNKKKATHSFGSHHDSLDDIRLQDLTYNPAKHSKKTQHNKKNQKAIHNKNYLRKLKLWKAKMMSKRKNIKLSSNKKSQHP